jgi:hypothetical protein
MIIIFRSCEIRIETTQGRALAERSLVGGLLRVFRVGSGCLTIASTPLANILLPLDGSHKFKVDKFERSLGLGSNAS